MDAQFEKSWFHSDFPLRCGKMNGTDSYLYHWHDEVEILCGIRGRTNVSIETHFYSLTDEDVLIIAPRQNHCLYTAGSQDWRAAICFDPRYFFKSAKNLEIFSRIACHSSEWSIPVRKKIYTIARDIYREYTQGYAGWEDAITAKIHELMVLLIREVPASSVTAPENSQKTQSLKRILEYISDNYAQDLSLSGTASALGFNEAYLSSMFKKSMGVSFTQYLLTLRLNKAVWLLKETPMPVSEVAGQSGFSSLKTFHRVFKNAYGTSPGQYRTSLYLPCSASQASSCSCLASIIF